MIDWSAWMIIIYTQISDEVMSVRGYKTMLQYMDAIDAIDVIDSVVWRLFVGVALSSSSIYAVH